MKPEMKVLHDAALKSLTAAKACRNEAGNVPADKLEEFNAHMADWTTNHAAFNQMKETEEKLAQMDAGLELYTQPAPGFVQNQPAPNQAELDTAARANHKAAMGRFMHLGTNGLSRDEQAAYMAGPRALFGQNPQETLAKMLPAEQHALLGTVDNLGGFLVPDEFMSELIKDVAGFSVMRPLARVRQTSRSSATFMTVASGTDPWSSGLTGNFRSEGWVVAGAAPPTQNQPTFGRERVPVHIWAPDIIELTMELLDDSAVNLDVEIRALLAETRGLDEDSVFINGTGVGMPLGILQEVALGNITTVQSGAANAQSYAGLVNLFTGLPAQYRSRASFMLNSFTLGLWMQLEDTAGTNIFPTNTVPTQLFGRPLAVTEFMPDGNVDGNDAVIFGDFSYYGIADRMDMRIIRLVERFAPNIGILAVARVGGQLLKTAPFRAQNVGA
jgi:HK97 family phage major capsid protein